MPDNLSYHEQEKSLVDAIKYKPQHPTASYHFLQRHFQDKRSHVKSEQDRANEITIKDYLREAGGVNAAV